MRSNIQQTLVKYSQLYKKLYNRDVKGVRVIDDKLVVINNTQILVSDLEALVKQLEAEYQAQQKKQRSVVMRLIGWLKQS